jgi:manganese-dependent inorganic pyrophosphatase
MERFLYNFELINLIFEHRNSFKLKIVWLFMVYVVGHRVPDSDSVCAAIALAELKGFEARVAGGVNAETRFILDRFSVEVPGVLDSVSCDDEAVLVDHSDLSQAVDGMGEAKVVGIVDHHKLGGVKTCVPVGVLVRPLGSTCTIVKGLYDYYGKEISREMAGIMLCAILSDTVIFRSPTTTDEDRRVAEELAGICGEDDLERLGMEMFKVKSEVEGIGARDLVMRDYKDFDMGGKKIGVGQLELVDLGMIVDRKDELIGEMEKMLGEGRDNIFLMLTDVLKEGTELLEVGGDLRSEIFGENEDGWFGGMMSRKKQVIPLLERYFS